MALRRYVGVVGFGLVLSCLLPFDASAAQSIRVLLGSEVQQVEVQATGTIWMTDELEQAQALQPTVRVQLHGSDLLVDGVPIAGKRVLFRAGDRDLKLWFPHHKQSATGRASHKTDEKGIFQVTGLVQVLRQSKGLLVINLVDLEEYVKGVVPSEVNSTWHMEMLKAQAVAARTYALYHHMLSAARDYDVVASIHDQVYRGRRGIDARITQAVESTRGVVITHGGAPIYAAFSSTAAGVTEDAMVVWAKDLPYLKGVECPFDLNSPYYQWKASFRVDELEKKLRQQGFSVGTITTVTPQTFSRARRVATLRVVHSKGELILRGEDLRKAVGYTAIPSTQFSVESIGQDIILAGYGAGHAVGLCQWGARELADLGYSFSSILRYYYPGTTLQDASVTHAPASPS